MLERTPDSPPVIQHVPNHIKRPLWSVMIPTYNDLPHLEKTIECVLAHNIGPETMQIVVVDDCSTKGDVRAVVQSIGNGRVEYCRHDQNVGSLRNFEKCLNLSTGQWVHILHGDDQVMLGFYEEIEVLFRSYPQAGAAFTNMAHTTVGSDTLEIHPPLANEAGILQDFLFQNAQRLILQPPSMVVKRSVYEKLGGFYAVHYGEDWEMWTRIAAHYPVAYSPECLAIYRYWSVNSITQHSIASGKNIQEIKKVIDIIQSHIPLKKRRLLKRLALKNYALYCLELAKLLYPTDRASAFVQAQGAIGLSTDREVLSSFLKYVSKDIFFAIRSALKIK